MHRSYGAWPSALVLLLVADTRGASDSKPYILDPTPRAAEEFAFVSSGKTFYRQPPVPNMAGPVIPGVHLDERVDLPDYNERQRLQDPARVDKRHEHHPVGESHNIPSNVQSFLSRSGRVRYTSGVGTAPKNSRCAFPFTAKGRRYDDCITEDFGESNLDNIRHPQSMGTIRTPVGEGAGVHIGHGWCSIDHEFVGRWGECFAPGYEPSPLNGGNTTANQHPHPHSQYWNPVSCIHAVMPRCAEREGGEIVTIVGRGFVSNDLSANFSMGETILGSPHVTFVSHKELQVVVPPFYNLIETTKGQLRVGSNGFPVHFCSDVSTTDTYMHIPQFTIQGANRRFFVSDVRNHRVHKVDYTTGMSDTFEQHSGGLKAPAGLELGPDGALYVASSGSDEILRYDPHTLHFLGRWALVQGGPRGIKWKGHELFVVSSYQRRVLRFKHHNGTVNWRVDERGRQGTFAGYFTEDMKRLSPHFAGDQEPKSLGTAVTKRLEHPEDLAFHAVDGELKLFVTSTHGSSVIQFNGITGSYERVFNDVPIKMVSTIGIAHRGFNKDIYLSSPHGGVSFVRVDGTNGRLKRKFSDISLRRPKSLIILGDTLMLSDREAVRTYDIDSGTPLQDAVTIQGARLGMMAWDMQCNADYSVDVGLMSTNWDRKYDGGMGNPVDDPPSGIGSTQPSSCTQDSSCSWDNPVTDYGAEDPTVPHRTDLSTPYKDNGRSGNGM